MGEEKKLISPDSDFLDGTTTEEIFSNSDRAIINFARESGFLHFLLTP